MVCPAVRCPGSRRREPPSRRCRRRCDRRAASGIAPTGQGCSPAPQLSCTGRATRRLSGTACPRPSRPPGRFPKVACGRPSLRKSPGLRPRPGSVRRRGRRSRRRTRACRQWGAARNGPAPSPRSRGPRPSSATVPPRWRASIGSKRSTTGSRFGLLLSDGVDAPFRRHRNVPCWRCRQRQERKGASMERVSMIGIDLAKNSFQAHGARADGSVAFRRKLSRAKILDFVRARGGGFARYGAGSAALPVQGLRQDLQRAERYAGLTAALHGSDGGVCQRPLLGPGDRRSRPCGATDPAGLCQSLNRSTSSGKRTTRPTRRRYARRHRGRP